jgi:hypothetical protein
MDASSLTLEYLSSVLLEHLYNCIYILYIVMLQLVIVQWYQLLKIQQMATRVKT